MTFGEPYSVSELGIAIVIFAVPLFLGHRDALIAANLIISLVTILGASSLLYTTGDTPYECFTSMGTYEDHTSGLDGFGFWLVIAAFFSYVFLLIDLAIWSVKSWSDSGRTPSRGGEGSQAVILGGSVLV